MKIVYILEQFYLHGGAEKTTANKVNWLSKNGFDITIISTNQNKKKHIYPLDNNIIFIDLDINYKIGTSYLHPKHLKLVPKHIIKLHEVLSKIKPDFIITLSLQFDYYFLPFIAKAKTIREFHSSRYLYDINRNKTNSFYKKIKFKLHDFIEKKYTYNVVLTPDEKKHYKNKNTFIIPNGISNIKEKQSNLNHQRIIAAGRLTSVKNFENLLDIWQEVSIKNPNWRLDIYGEGDIEYKKKLQNKILSLGIKKSCCICGSTKDLDKEMVNSSIYAMTSITECYPMVLLEAQSVGLPIVSFDCPYGPRNIINDLQTGFLVKTKNEFKEQLTKLITNKTLRHNLGEQAKKSVQTKHIDNVMKQWIDLFKQKNK